MQRKRNHTLYDIIPVAFGSCSRLKYSCILQPSIIIKTPRITGHMATYEPCVKSNQIVKAKTKFKRIITIFKSVCQIPLPLEIAVIKAPLGSNSQALHASFVKSCIVARKEEDCKQRKGSAVFRQA